ncbi:hypothetical protein KF840_13210 [bacterium]|nr:hypothetical protein [bacterium]
MPQNTSAAVVHGPNANAIVTVRWALILTCAYLMLMGRSGGGAEVPTWLGPLLIAAYLASNLAVGRAQQPYSQGLKVGLAVLDSCFIAASLWVAGQLSVELLLLCLGVLVLAIAGLSVGTIAGVTIGLALASLAVSWLTGDAPPLQSSLLLRVPFLLGAAMVFALLVDNRRGGAGPLDRDDLMESLSAHVTQQHDALRRCNAALADGAVKSAHTAMEDVIFHNRQMAQKLGRFRPEGARHAA